MSDRAAYSRVYWTILSDDKFVEIRAHPDLLGCWLLLLVTADAMYPAPAFVPSVVKPRHLRALVSSGLVDLAGSGMYRIHGLQAERERRASAARRGGGRDPGGTRAGGTREANGSLGLDEDETRTSNTPPPPTSGGRRSDRTNPRATRTAPRDTATNPRKAGTSVRQKREDLKTGPTALGDVMRRISEAKS
jgi:hypothetical protein